MLTRLRVRNFKRFDNDGLDIWSPDVKASDHGLNRFFRVFFKKLGLPLQLRKADYHVLASLMPKEKLDREIVEKLDSIVTVASAAKPRT